MGTASGECVCGDRGAGDRNRLVRPRRDARLRRLRRDRGRGRVGRPGTAGCGRHEGAAHEPRQPRAAVDPLRADRRDRARGGAGPERAAVSADRPRGRAERRHPPVSGGERRGDRGPPVPVALAVLGHARRPPVSDRPRAGRSAGEDRPAGPLRRPICPTVSETPSRTSSRMQVQRRRGSSSSRSTSSSGIPGTQRS